MNKKLTKEDNKLLSLMYKNKYQSSYEIALKMSKTFSPIQRRLKKLYEYGLLDRKQLISNKYYYKLKEIEEK